MRVGCVYSVERAASRKKPLLFAMDIPFGISTIATILEHSGHAVDLFVFSPESDDQQLLADYIAQYRPKLFCCTAVSTQFPFVRQLISTIKKIDPSIYTVLGGHHASLDPEGAIQVSDLDAICVGEGDQGITQLAGTLEVNQPVTGIPSLWIKRPDGSVEKNPPLPFQQNLDELPYINRRMWEPWLKEPDRYPAVLLGRGCPFGCTYCSNHAMRRLSTGRYTRFRSPGNIVGEIRQICSDYPNVDSIYLEVETIAHQKEAIPLFQALETFNQERTGKIGFGLNFTVTSTFIRNEEKSRDFLSMLKRAHVVYMNIGLESGSEQLRREVLRRPKYSNAEFLRFAQLASEYGIDLNFYVLIGVPGETLADYRQTLSLVRQSMPKMVFLSIFYPYLGTDLYTIAAERGLIPRGGLDPAAERARAALDLPGFSRARIRLEYVLFWYKAFRGHWPMSKIMVETAIGLIKGSPHLWDAYLFLQERSTVYKWLKRLYHKRAAGYIDHRSHTQPGEKEYRYTE